VRSLPVSCSIVRQNLTARAALEANKPLQPLQKLLVVTCDTRAVRDCEDPLAERNSLHTDTQQARYRFSDMIDKPE
jgi:hypothetical protein